MANSLPDPNSDPDNTGMRPDRRSPPSTPRWVKASALIVVILVVAFVVIHLSGGGFGRHAPLIQSWVQRP